MILCFILLHKYMMQKYSCPFDACPRSYSSRTDLDHHISESHIDQDDLPAPKSPVFPEHRNRQPIPEEDEDSENVSSSEDSTPTPVPSFRSARPIPSIMPKVEPATDQALTDEMIREVSHTRDLETVTDVGVHRSSRSER